MSQRPEIDGLAYAEIVREPMAGTLLDLAAAPLTDVDFLDLVMQLHEILELPEAS